jgi:chromate reductase, NAD(P)H dehydrogenase (quinone)
LPNPPLVALAISGSLRTASINSAFCRAAAKLAAPPLQVIVFRELGHLPLFNPDLEADPPGAVVAFRNAVGKASALIIASPEYAHGISGVLKNALDWLVSYEGFVDKPIALVNASPRARLAFDALHEVLRTMSANILSQASVTLPLLGSCVTEEAMLASGEVSESIGRSLAALTSALLDEGHPGAAFPVN